MRPLSATVAFLAIAAGLATSACHPSTPTPEPSPQAGPKPIVHALKISRYAATPLDEPSADAILFASTNVLQGVDHPGDVSCQVVLQRDGAITTFGQGSAFTATGSGFNGTVGTQAELNDIMAVQGNVKVVNALNFCVGINPGVVGCGQHPGTSFVVERSASLPGIVWAHEYGHNKGLGHRPDPDAIMFDTINGVDLDVTTSECNAFRN